jgi:cytochrome c oxidase assembly factor CtaG
VTDRAAVVRPHGGLRSSGAVAAVRVTLSILAAALLVLSVVPPLATYARRFEFVEALQFCLLGIVVPVCVACGAPWRHLGLAAAEPPGITEDGDVVAPAGLRPIDRLALGRRHHTEPWRAVVVAGAYLGVVVLWRIPLTVDALARHGWLALVEAVTLVPAAVAVWLELVESPPVSPRLTRPHRVGMAAVVMWVIWVLAYLVGMAHGAWYDGFDHTVATGMSVSADQQLTTGIIWMVSGLAFVPVVFWNLIYWLQSEEDPDDELNRLFREERARGRTVDHGAGPA